MSVIVLVIGVVVTGLGLAALGFAIPIIELSLGATLVTVGTIAFCSGLILVGLAAAVAELRRVGDLLRARPMRRVDSQPQIATVAPAPAPTVSMPVAPSAPALPIAPPPPSLGPLPAQAAHPQAAPPTTPAPLAASQRPAPPPARQRPEMPVAHDQRHPEPAPSPSADVSATAIERLRSTITRTERQRPEPAMVPEGEDVPLSPNGGHAQVQARRQVSEPALEPRLSPDDRLGGGTADTAKASRLDFLFRSRQQAAARAGQGESNWSPGQTARGGPEAGVQPRHAESGRSTSPASTPPVLPESQAAPTAEPAQPQPAEPRPRDLGASAAQPSGTVLKSGVVDGMAYTLYTDGSIEANLPDGTVRFNSIADLRAHIEKHP
ncbi:MAG: hypothetical protein AB7S93_15140 [Xanthobacteraceae bacterium]